MEINFNIQGNGTCPYCKKYEECYIINLIEENLLENIRNPEDMEIVIYSCPEFEEEDCEE